MLTAKSVDRISKLRGQIHTIPADATIHEAAVKLSRCNVGCLLALSTGGKIVGILSERDIITKVIAPGGEPRTAKVQDVMTRSVVSCAPGTPADEAKRIMACHGIRHLPIVDRGIPVGMVSSRDILAHQLNQAQAMLEEQTRLLSSLESQHPGITRLPRDTAGRVMI